MSSPKLAKLLIKAGLLPEDASAALLKQEQAAQPLTIDTLFCQAGHAEPVQLDHFLAETYRLPKIDLTQVVTPSPEALAALTADQVDKYKAFPYAIDDESLWIAATLPLRLSRLQSLGEQTGRTLKISPLNQIYFTLLAEQYYEIPPPEEIQEILDEWPLPSPEEAEDMLYEPPPLPKDKPERASSASIDLDPALSTSLSNASIELSSAASAAAIESKPDEESISPHATQPDEPPAQTTTETIQIAETSEAATSTKATTESDAYTGDSGTVAFDPHSLPIPEPTVNKSTAAPAPNDLPPISLALDPSATPASTSSDQMPSAAAIADALALEITMELGQIDDIFQILPSQSTSTAAAKTATAKEAAPHADEEMASVIPLGVYEAEFLLRESLQADVILELGLYFFANKLEHAALFRLRKQQIVPHRMIAPLPTAQDFKQLSFALGGKTFFQSIQDSLIPYQGPPSEEDADQPLFALFDPAPHVVYLFPIRVRGRTVAILYGHRTTEAMNEIEFEQCMRCSYQMSQSLEHAIIAAKKGHAEEKPLLQTALQALRKSDISLLRHTLAEAYDEIAAIERQAQAAIERVQEEERRIAEERAAKLAFAAELALAAKQQAAARSQGAVTVLSSPQTTPSNAAEDAKKLNQTADLDVVQPPAAPPPTLKQNTSIEETSALDVVTLTPEQMDHFLKRSPQNHRPAENPTSNTVDFLDATAEPASSTETLSSPAPHTENAATLVTTPFVEPDATLSTTPFTPPEDTEKKK